MTNEVEKALTHCGAKHTVPQIPDDKWACPKCGVGSDAQAPFVIEDRDANSSDDCALLHAEDYCVCGNCGFVASGSSLARRYAKEQALIPCPRCKGTGMIDGRKP